MSVQIKKFRTIVNKHIKFNEMNPPEKLNVVPSDTGSYAYLSECVADNNPANFKGLTESEEGGTWILPGDNTYTINYDAALIAFASTFTIPNTLYAHYWGGGSVIWAEDVTDLQEACNTIHDNALYKDGSVALEGNLNLNGHQLRNVTTINSINLGTHKHLGQEIDGTTQLTEDSISDLSMSKITGLQTALDSKQNKLPTYQSGKYLTNNGSSLSWGNASVRNIGEIVQSLLPLSDPKLHLLDGAELSGTSTYKDLYNYLINNSTITTLNSGINVFGSLQNNNGVLSGFSNTNYATLPFTFGPSNSDWEVRLKFHYVSSDALQQLIGQQENYTGEFVHDIYLVPRSNKPIVLHVACQNSDGSVFDQALQSDNYSLVNNTDYWIKYGYSNNTLYIEISTDGLNYSSILSYSANGLKFYTWTKHNLKFGINIDGIFSFQGSIDTNQCYIIENNSIIWQGNTPFYKIQSDFIVDESIWQGTVYRYFTCGKFVLDVVNKTVRLPLIVNILEGTINSTQVGDLIEAGLPNITGHGFGFGYKGFVTYSSGAMSTSNENPDANYGASSSGDWRSFNNHFDASKSNSIYGNSDTVQPQTIRVLNYIVVSK